MPWFSVFVQNMNLLVIVRWILLIDWKNWFNLFRICAINPNSKIWILLIVIRNSKIWILLHVCITSKWNLYTIKLSTFELIKYGTINFYFHPLLLWPVTFTLWLRTCYIHLFAQVHIWSTHWSLTVL